jgi:hypothetical protein
MDNADKDSSTPRTEIELILQINKPLLIVFTPLRPKDSWWRDRKGMLKLLPNQEIIWSSDHLSDSVKLSYKEDIEKLANHWNIFLACCEKNDRTWYEWDYGSEWRSEPHGTIFSVNPCNFNLGNKK